MTPPNAAKGRALLEEWKAEHKDGGGFCIVCDALLSVALMYPCPTMRLVAAVEEALGQLGQSARLDRTVDVRRILAKLEAPE